MVLFCASKYQEAPPSQANKLSPLTPNLCPAHRLRCCPPVHPGCGWREVAAGGAAWGPFLSAGPTGAQTRQSVCEASVYRPNIQLVVNSQHSHSAGSSAALTSAVSR